MFTSEEEIKLKRTRGEISCAECRRSKLKCDKVRLIQIQVSISALTKKKLINLSKLHVAHVYAGDARAFVQTAHSSVAPVQGMCAGSIWPMNVELNTPRSCAPDTEQLHRKISEMGQRIRQLEDALAILQSSVSTEPHPLLEDEPVLSVNSSTAKAPDVLTETMDAFGTLTIGDSWESKYFGSSAGSEVRSSTMRLSDITNAFQPRESDSASSAPLHYPSNFLPNSHRT